MNDGAVRFLGKIVSVVLIAIVLALGWLWYTLYADKMATLPAVRTLERLAVPIPDSGSEDDAVIFGRIELGQTEGLDSAEIRHIALYGGPEGPSIANVAGQRLLQLRYEEASLPNMTALLGDGDVLQLGAASYGIAIDGAQLSLTREGTEAPVLTLPRSYGTRQPGLRTWPSRSVSIGGRVAHDPDLLSYPGWIGRQKRLIEAWALQRAAPAILLPQPDIPEDSATIARGANGYLLRLKRGMVAVLCPKDGTCYQVGRQRWPLQGSDRLGDLQEIIAGRTTYAVDIEGREVLFRPVERGHWLPLRDVPDVPGARYTPKFKRGLPADAAPPGALAALTGLFIQPSLVALVTFAAIFAAFRVPIGSRPLAGAAVLLAVWLGTIAATPATTQNGFITNRPELLFLVAALALFVQPARAALALATRGNPLSRGLGDNLDFVKSRIGTDQLLFTPLGVALLVALSFTDWLGISTPGVQDRNTDLFHAHVAVIALFMLVLLGMMRLLRVSTAGNAMLVVFWGAATVVSALGAVSLAYLALGHRFAVHEQLYDRHLLALGAIGTVSAVLVWSDPRALIEALKAFFRWSYRSLRVELRWLLAAVGVVIGLLVGILSWWALAVTDLSALLPARDSLQPAPIAVAVLVLGLIGLTVFRKRHGLGTLLHRRITIPSVVLVVLSLAMGALVFVTPEAGIGGVQPSELAKTWLAVLLALILAGSLERREWLLSFERGASLILLILVYLMVALFFAAGSFINFDLSPIAIILAMTSVSLAAMGVYFFFAWLPRPLRLLLAAIVLLALVAGGASAMSLAAACILLLILVTMRGAPGDVRQRIPSIGMIRSEWYLGARNMERNTLPTLADLTKAAGALVLLVGVWMLVVQPGAARVADFVNETDKLETLQADLGVIDMPSVPQERVLAFQDANLFKAPDGANGALVVEHPDHSLQVRKSREVLAATGCGLVDQVSGYVPPALADVLRPVVQQAERAVSVFADPRAVCPRHDTIFPFDGAVPGAVIRVPAIQDDFATTFLIGSLGMDAGLILIVAQAIMVTAMIAIGVNGLLQTGDLPSFQGVGTFGAVAVGNLAVILSCQFVLSWSNIFGLLPVVGQPMTFASFGASHHLAFGLPAVALTVAVAMTTKPEALQARVAQPIHGLTLRRFWGPVW